MKKFIIATFIALLSITTVWAQKIVVWDNPTTEYGTNYGDGFFNIVLDLTKVEMKEAETVVYMTIQQRSDYPNIRFKFAGDTYLCIGNKHYPVCSADGIELNKFTQTNKDGRLDVVFHFKPLPQGTKSFDFIEGDGQGAFQIKGIKSIENRWNQLFPSYWRDEETGNWEIALLEDCAIYQCKFWSYKRCEVKDKTGEADIVMCNGDDELHIKVGKNKKGKRTIHIGKQKVTYSMITSRFMPDYPVKDTRTDFVNNGYKVDTVTVVGWIKDMPEHYKHEKTFSFTCENIFTCEQGTVSADLDEKGRFTAKIPVINSTGFFCDWSRCFVRTIFEPGKTYFMLYDFKEGRRYFMGDDTRLQNELFKYPLEWKSIQMKDGEEFNKYIASVDSLLKAQYAYIDELCESHPLLSTRFNKYRKGNTLCQQARDFGQACLRSKDYQFFDIARKYAYGTFYTKLEEPLTLHRDITGFLRDYISDAMRNSSSFFSWKIAEHLAEIASNDEELAMLTRWSALTDEAIEKIKSASTMEEKERISNELNTNNADLKAKIEEILNGQKVRKLIGGEALISAMNTRLHLLDSLNSAPIIKDIELCRMVYEEINRTCSSLNSEVIDTLKALVSNPIGIEMVEKRNNNYIAIENRKFDKLVLKSYENLKDFTEGEALLKKILEPFRGKFVLLDVWGTWCGPCKDALSHSSELYARLSKYDITYLYLANRSPMESWENIIKEYNLTGNNVAHYNLPAQQQSAIERELKVHSYPTYKLFNREGNLLDLKVDARNIDNLEDLLKRLSNQ
ncbi:TlpA family protein disulfide reductase [Bacteroidaceae bacterium HV4-6-C5C]|nr:TlpA family protein disulfide reductase [Bacteroidaceae bacterium HV4-6-C5C]